MASRDAQDALLDRNISLALNMKRANLDRLSRCTGVPVSSISPFPTHYTLPIQLHLNSMFLEIHTCSERLGHLID